VRGTHQVVHAGDGPLRTGPIALTTDVALAVRRVAAS
jgi:hypothetical protein